jgi:hypothetical protein
VVSPRRFHFAVNISVRLLKVEAPSLEVWMHSSPHIHP